MLLVLEQSPIPEACFNETSRFLVRKLSAIVLSIEKWLRYGGGSDQNSGLGKRLDPLTERMNLVAGVVISSLEAAWIKKNLMQP